MDATRALTSKGLREVNLLRQFRKDLGIKFDVVFSSDFARAVECLPIANKKAPRFQLKELRPLGTAEDAFTVMRGAFDIADDTRVLVITHDPLIAKLAAVAWIGFNPDINPFSHGTMLRVDTHEIPAEKHPFHWMIRPSLLEAMYESDLVESATQLVEHLGRASKARIVDPLIERLRGSVSARFKRQRRLYEQMGAFKLADAAFHRRFTAVTDRAYNGGAQYVAASLAVLQEATPRLKARRQPTGYERMPDAVEREIDATTRERVAAIEKNGRESGLTAAAITAAVLQQFREWSGDRARTIAEHEVSRAFHAGGRAVAKIVNEENGGRYVQRHWDVQDNPCELCQENEEAGWIGEDEQYPNFPEGPPGHVHCVCSESFRTVGQQSEEARR